VRSRVKSAARGLQPILRRPAAISRLILISDTSRSGLGFGRHRQRLLHNERAKVGNVLRDFGRHLLVQCGIEKDGPEFSSSAPSRPRTRPHSVVNPGGQIAQEAKIQQIVWQPDQPRNARCFMLKHTSDRRNLDNVMQLTELGL
jgi:hypothetical protein